MNIAVCFSIAGLDYSNETRVVSMISSVQAMSSNENFTTSVVIIDDNVVELTETFSAMIEVLPAEQVSLSNTSITTATIVILDDDGKTP